MQFPNPSSNPMTIIPEITNLIEWENASSLSESDQLFLRDFDKKPLVSKESSPIKTSSLMKPSIFPEINAKMPLINNNSDNMYEIINELKEIKSQNSAFSKILEEILKNLDSCELNLNDLSLTKENLIKKINELYQESSEIIEQQKNLLDFSAVIKSNLLYYSEYKRLEQDIDNIHLNLASKETFESNLQRYLSEIMDGMYFFEMKPNYKNSKLFLENYSKLKKRLLIVIKTLFLKILNKEFTDISSNLIKIPSQDFLQNYNNRPDITNNNNQEVDKSARLIKEPSFSNISIDYDNLTGPNANRSLFLVTFYPEFKVFFNDLLNKEDINEPFVKINETLRNLLAFLFRVSKNDWDVNEILIDLFESYYPYYRTNILLLFCEKINKAMNSNKSSPKKLPNLVENFMLFSYETAFYEYCYYLFLFNFDKDCEKAKIIGFMHGFCEKFYDFIRPFLVREGLLLHIYECIDILNNFQLNSMKIITNFMDFPALKQILRKNLNKDYYIESFMKIIENDVFLKVKQDLMQKLVFLIQGFIQEKIVNFDLKSYFQTKKVKKLLPFTTIEANKRNEVFPLVMITIELIKNLKDRMEKSILQEIIYEVMNTTLNMIYTVAETFEGKFDSFLFLINHLLLLNQSLSEIGIEILVKEQKLDFSETKNTLFELISGNYNGNLEANRPKENNWNILNFLSRGMPKVNEYIIDVKKNLTEQLNQLNNRCLKDMSFIISKNICDFLRKYHYFKNLLKHVNNNEVNLKKDLDNLLHKDNIKKIYEVFYESFIETIEEIVSKANNYLDNELFGKVGRYFDAIIENVILLLYQFYIIAAENSTNEDYKTFKFMEIEEIRRELKKKIVFIY